MHLGLKVIIKKIKDDTIIFELPDKQTIVWPRKNLPPDFDNHDNFQLIITSSRNLINEIISARHENEK